MKNLPIDSASIIQKIDSMVRDVRTRNLDISFNELYDMYINDELIIRPEFQRLFRWSEAKQSQFIESLILELPIPPIYVIEKQDGVYELIDGLQRISSYLHFRNVNIHSNNTVSALTLVGCDILVELNGLTFDELPLAIKIKLKRHFIRMDVLRKESNNKLKYYMFKRLNTGGEILSPQELRNSTMRLINDKFCDFLIKIVQNEDYKECMDYVTPEKKDQMYFEEYALRYFALKNYVSEYEKDVGEFLTTYMELVSSELIAFNYKNEEENFYKTFLILKNILGSFAFSRTNKSGNQAEYFSSLIFEAITLGLQENIDNIDLNNVSMVNNIRSALINMKNQTYFKSETTGGGKTYAASLRRRVGIVTSTIEACLK